MHAKSKISGMLPKSFKPQKCKTSLKLAVSRMKLLKNKREALVKQMRRDLAQLLESGQEQTARIRVEHVIREEKTMSAYDLIEIYCEIIDSRLPIIESQKNCPIDLKEAISSVIFASPRCADVPELMDIRKHFTAKYGKDFVKAAIEVRPDCGVSSMMIEKLSAKAPDIQTKIKNLNEVAKEHNIKWEPKAFEEQLQKPKDDLLSGPSSFVSGEKMTIKFSDVKPSSLSNWNNESTPKISQYNLPSQAQEILPVVEEVKSAHGKEESDFIRGSSWKMEFKDAASAAKAAAESAERASMAARAAADLASRGNVSRQSSSASHESFECIISSEGTESVKSSYPESNFNTRGSVIVEDNERKGSRVVKLDNMKKDELVRSGRLAADENLDNSNTESYYSSGGSVPVVDNEKTNIHFGKQEIETLHKDELVRKSTLSGEETLNTYHLRRENVMSEKPQSNNSSMGHMAWGFNLPEMDDKSSDYAHKRFTVIGSASKNVKNDNIDNYGQSHETSPPVYSSAFDEYEMKDEHENNIEADSSAVSFDNYDTDSEDHSFNERCFETNLFDSFLPQPREEPSSLLMNTDSWSYKQQTMGCPSKQTSSQLQSLAEFHQTDNPEMVKKADVHSDSDDSQTPKYDSEELSSEIEENEVEKPYPREVRPTNFLPSDSYSKGSAPAPASPSRGVSHMVDTMEADEGKESSRSALFARVENLEAEPSYNDKSWRSGISVRNTQQSQRIDTSHLNDRGSGTTEETAYSVASEEESSSVLNFGALTGGLKQRGYYPLTYVRHTNVKTSSVDSPHSKEKEISVSVPELSTSIDVTSEEKCSEVAPTNASRQNSRVSRFNANTDFENEGRLALPAEGRESRSEYFSLNRKSRVSRANVETDLENEGSNANLVVGRESRYEGSSSVTGRPFSSQYRKNSEDTEHPFQESDFELRQRKEDKESMARSLGTNPSVDKKEKQISNAGNRRMGGDVSALHSQKLDGVTSSEKSSVYDQTRTYMKSEIPDEQTYHLKPFTRADNDSSSRVPISYSNVDDTRAEEPEPQTTSMRGQNLVKHSRRTRPTPLVSKQDEVRRDIDQSDMGPMKEPRNSLLYSVPESSSSEKAYSGNLDNVEPKHLQTESSSGISLKSSQDGSRKHSAKENDEKLTVSSSKEKSTSRENSLTNASHTHPKLPDYDSIAAHFHSLRANVQRK